MLKSLFAFIFLYSFSAVAKPVEFVVTSVTWCNGNYVGGPDVSDCPYYQTWNGIQLKSIKKIIVDVPEGENTIRFLTIKDSLGHTWKKNLYECDPSRNNCESLSSMDERGDVNITYRIYGRNRGSDFKVQITDGKRGYLHLNYTSSMDFEVMRK